MCRSCSNDLSELDEFLAYKLIKLTKIIGKNKLWDEDCNCKDNKNKEDNNKDKDLDKKLEECKNKNKDLQKELDESKDKVNKLQKELDECSTKSKDLDACKEESKKMQEELESLRLALRQVITLNKTEDGELLGKQVKIYHDNSRKKIKTHIVMTYQDGKLAKMILKEYDMNGKEIKKQEYNPDEIPPELIKYKSDIQSSLSFEDVIVGH